MPCGNTIELIMFLNNVLIHLDTHILTIYEIENMNTKIKNNLYFSKEIDKILEEINMYKTNYINNEMKKDIYFSKIEHIINILSRKL